MSESTLAGGGCGAAIGAGEEYTGPGVAGGAIGMAQALQEEMVEYEDGTEASISQMAKDVTHFLAWTAEP